jgi:DNA-binding NarL/FixJ family response regulator
VADENALTRFGIRRALEESGFCVCAEACDAAGATESALEERPDICLLGLDMPGDGIGAIRRITSRLQETAVVMLTDSGDEGDLLGALCAGASGYLPKDIDPGRLPLALQGVVPGDVALPRALLLRLMEEARHSALRRGSALSARLELTTRESEVLKLLRKGLTTGEIARHLFISQVTVRTHVCSIVKKLHVPDRKAAIRLLEKR